MLTEKEIEEFKRLIKKIYQKDVSSEFAEDQGSRLVILFEMIIKHKQKRLIKKADLQEDSPQDLDQKSN